MAQIRLKSRISLNVTEEQCKRVFDLCEEYRGSELGDKTPITVTHEDGTWSGSLEDIDEFFFTDKSKEKFKFKSDEDIHRFHQEYGYGGAKEVYNIKYGLVDVKTQFLIKTKQADISSGRLVYLPMNPDTRKYWRDVWETYQELVDSWKI